MIAVNGKKIGRAWINGKPVAMLFTATKKVWESVRSCFGGGFWHEPKQWLDTEKWKES